MKKLQEMVNQKTKLVIGDVVRVRGYIRTYRQQREIQASCFCKCYRSVTYVTWLSVFIRHKLYFNSLNNFQFVFWQLIFLKRFSSVCLYFNFSSVRLENTLLNVWDQTARK